METIKKVSQEIENYEILHYESVMNNDETRN